MDKGRTLVYSAAGLSSPIFGAAEVKETSLFFFLDLWAVALLSAHSTSEPLSGIFCPVESSWDWEWCFALELEVV